MLGNLKESKSYKHGLKKKKKGNWTKLKRRSRKKKSTGTLAQKGGTWYFLEVEILNELKENKVDD